jgi:hypothetical protein
MKREVYVSQKPFAGEKKPSMLRRCVGHDYGERMMYMLTMVTEGRRPLFCNVLASVLCIDIAHEALPAAMRADGLLLTTSSHSGRLKFVSIIYSHNSLFLQ